MKILFIAPLPPPITGQSIAAKVLLDEISKYHLVEVVNLRKSTFKQGISSFGRIIQTLNTLKHIWKGKNSADVVYFTISQSIAGNIKDLLIYLILYNKLSDTIIHLHGGGIKKLIFEKYYLLNRLNKMFLRQLSGVIVLGQSLVSVFEGMISKNRIYVIPNFAEDNLFLSIKKIEGKFQKLESLKILFCGNLIAGKGYKELVDAYKNLSDNLQKRVRVDFAGEFESKDEKAAFLNTIEEVKGIRYHGVVSGDEKRRLFAEAHVFCLPTYYPYYEGQPISILEAYASGCVVITTDHGGICDVFKDEVNGFQVAKKSCLSIKEKIEKIAKRPNELLPIAIFNRKIAYQKYTEANYKSALINVICSLPCNG